MLSKLFTYLKYEQHLLGELLSISEKQQKALIHFDTTMIQELASYQEEVARSLRETEEQRIKLLMTWLKLSRKEANELKLSSLERALFADEKIEMHNLRIELKKLIDKVQNFNSMNRILANRARTSVQELIKILTNGTNHVCNVRV